MAYVKKCDRCKCYYDENTRYPKLIGHIKTVVDGVCLTTKNGNTTRSTDLCDDCLHKIDLFLSGYELVGEGD